MSATLVAELQDQAQKFWSPIFVPELKEAAVLPTLVSKEYEGEIKREGDTVYVSMVQAATGQRKTVGSGHETFETEKLKTQRIGIVADQVISASFELDDLVALQTQLGSANGESEIRKSLMKAVELQLNDYLYSLVSPSTSAPDHLISGISDFNATQLLSFRGLASAAKWPMGEKWLLVDPSYQNDLLAAQTLTSSDFVGDDRAVVGGQIVSKRFGFNIVEDNSDAMKRLSPTLATSDLALAFHPSFMYLVMQQQPEFQISSLHSNKQFGYVISVKMVLGAKLGIQGSVKHIVGYNS